ncbi:hypothetical protein MIR68_003801 [Amoeboaphelidium protococcarum]|nr:hypothetical protein MIR68_003801 [Amoeboaphelidium protococcarum]
MKVLLSILILIAMVNAVPQGWRSMFRRLPPVQQLRDSRVNLQKNQWYAIQNQKGHQAVVNHEEAQTLKDLAHKQDRWGENLSRFTNYPFKTEDKELQSLYYSDLKDATISRIAK